MSVIDLIEEEIRPSSIVEKIRTDSCGAVVLFLGTVRSSSRDRVVTHLVYDAYREMALRRMEEIEREARTRWEVGEIAMVHRLGVLKVGEISLLIAVSSPHRVSAYEASRFLLEEIKREVPIWKKECWPDGEEWV